MGETYVNPTRLIESEDLAIVEFAAKAVGSETNAKAKVLKPFYAFATMSDTTPICCSATLRANRRGRRWVRLVGFAALLVVCARSGHPGAVGMRMSAITWRPQN